MKSCVTFYVAHMMYCTLYFVASSYVKSGQALFTKAEEAYCSKDEERAYILYMRFFNIVQCVKKSAEYKKNKVT